MGRAGASANFMCNDLKMSHSTRLGSYCHTYIIAAAQPLQGNLMRPIFYTTTLALLLAPACWAQTDAAVAAASKEAGAVVTKSGLAPVPSFSER